MSNQIWCLILILLHAVNAFAPAVGTCQLTCCATAHNSNESDGIRTDYDADIIKDTIKGVDLTPLQQVQILAYRSGLTSSAVLLSIHAIGDTTFWDGVGVSVDGISTVIEQTGYILPVVTGTSLALCPVPNQKVVQLGLSILGTLTVLSGSLTNEVAWVLTILSLVIISLREIYYFGFDYKQECGIVLCMSPFMLDSSNQFPFAMPLCALGLSILAAGKIFEPFNEDLVRSNSEFLAK
jgi:hypothetical protein